MTAYHPPLSYEVSKKLYDNARNTVLDRHVARDGLLKNITVTIFIRWTEHLQYIKNEIIDGLDCAFPACGAKYFLEEENRFHPDFINEKYQDETIPYFIWRFYHDSNDDSIKTYLVLAHGHIQDIDYLKFFL